MLTKVSSTAVSTCTTMNATESRDRFRCRLVTANLGSPGSRPCRLTIMPSTSTAVSNSNATIPVARLAYQNAVDALISGLFCSLGSQHQSSEAVICGGSEFILSYSGPSGPGRVRPAGHGEHHAGRVDQPGRQGELGEPAQG